MTSERPTYGGIDFVKQSILFYSLKKHERRSTFLAVARYGSDGYNQDYISLKTRCLLHWFSELHEDVNPKLRDHKQSGVHFFSSLKCLCNPSRARKKLEPVLSTFQLLWYWLDLQDENNYLKMVLKSYFHKYNSYLGILATLMIVKRNAESRETVDV